MANGNEELVDLLRRVDALEALVLTLRGRVESLEAADGGVGPDFHMPDQEQTI